jgi:hypothetical protein
MSFTAAEQAYLTAQFLGRLATIAPDGVPGPTGPVASPGPVAPHGD